MADHVHSATCPCSYEAKQADLDIGETLFACIDTSKMWALNASDPATATHCIKPHNERLDATRFLRSDDDDPDLILFVPFTQQVVLRSFCFIAGSQATAPTRVKVFVNRDDVDFAAAAELPATQAFDLAFDADGEIEYPVRVNKFTNVSSLLLFFTNADDDEATTQINYLGLKGTATKNKREVINVTYEAVANPADHKKTGVSDGAMQQLGQ
jgi:hypothetical protein